MIDPRIKKGADAVWEQIRTVAKEADCKGIPLKVAAYGILLSMFENVRELHERIDTIERNQKAMRYRGVWQPAETYEKGNFATYDGSLWIAVDDTPGRPGVSGWQLAAKRGRDARDA